MLAQGDDSIMTPGIQGGYQVLGDYGYAPGYAQSNGNMGYLLGDIGQDSYGFAQKPKKKSFSLLNAAGNLFKGAVLNPLKSLFSLQGLATAGLAAGAIALFGAPAAIGLGAIGLITGGLQAFRGGKDFIGNYMAGNMEAAERSFEDIGSGTTTGLLSAAGIRASGGNLSITGGLKGIWNGIWNGRTNITNGFNNIPNFVSSIPSKLGQLPTALVRGKDQARLLMRDFKAATGDWINGRGFNTGGKVILSRTTLLKDNADLAALSQKHPTATFFRDIKSKQSFMTRSYRADATHLNQFAQSPATYTVAGQVAMNGGDE